MNHLTCLFRLKSASIAAFPGRQTWLFSVLIGGVVLLLTGCPPTIQIAPPIEPGLGVADITAAEVARLVDDRRAQFQTLRGLGKIGIETWEERFRFSEVFILKTPARFRLETLGAFDQPAIFLTSDDTLLSLYSKKQNTFYQGLATQENLFKLSGINLSVEDTIFVLSGNPPLLNTVDAEWGLFLPGQQLYYLERLSWQENRVQRIWFDTTVSLIVFIREHQLPGGKIDLEIQFDDYRAEEGGYSIPRRIAINRPLDRTVVNIEYDYFFVNQDVEPELFTFQPPADAKIHILEDVHAEELEKLVPYDEFRVND